MGERLAVGDIELDVIRRGTGRTVLLLHGMQRLDPSARFLVLLSRQIAIIAPSHPGFGVGSQILSEDVLRPAHRVMRSQCVELIRRTEVYCVTAFHLTLSEHSHQLNANQRVLRRIE